MTITKIPTAHQQSIFSFLDERDLHFTWRSCKALQRTAGDNRLWKLFLTKRSIEPTENNKCRLTTFFKTSCAFFVRQVPVPLEQGKEGYAAVWDAVQTHLRSQKNHQLAMDADNQPRDVVVVSRGRWNEIHSGFIDVYDMFVAIFNAIKSTPRFIAEKGLHGVAQNSTDLDKFRFLLDVGVNPSKLLDEESALDLLLRNRRCSLEAVKLLVSAKAGFSEHRGVAIRNRIEVLESTIEIAARHCSVEVFCYLWSQHREVSQTPPGVDDTRNYSVTLANALCNSELVKKGAVIKMLIVAGARPDYNSNAFSVGFGYKIGDIGGCLNCALSHENCSTDTVRLLIEGGARPRQRLLQNKWLASAGSLDVAVHARHPKEVLELLLQHGATLSLADHELWPGTLEFARIRKLPAESLQLLEEAAARGQFPPEEQALPAQVQHAPVMPALQEDPVPEEVVPQEPIQELPPQVVNLPEVRDRGPEEPAADSLLQQILPAWLWNAFVAIDGFIRAIVMRIVNFFSQNEQ